MQNFLENLVQFQSRRNGVEQNGGLQIIFL